MPIPVISVEQMRGWEQATWATGQTSSAVIARVGEIIAGYASAQTKPGDFILVLAGKGNNGEDARQAIPHLSGRRVELLKIDNPKSALDALAALLKQGPALIIDGLFGIGLNRPLSEDWVELIRSVNATGAPVLAVDVPSGFNADNGGIEGESIRATTTLTLGAPKRGLVLPGTSTYVGRLEVAPDIGLIPCPFTGELLWTLPEDFTGFPPRRAVESHKGTYGHVAIIAGSPGYHGAAVLVARGAMRSQPGLVSLWVDDRVYVPVASQLQAVMVKPMSGGITLPETCSAIVLGPGLAAPDLAQETKLQGRELWQNSPLPVIADASALTWLPPGPVAPNAVRIMTPHPGEAARLLGRTSAEVQAQRVESLRELSLKYGRCWVVLKGHQTLVGRCEGPVFINPSGNPYLAQGGSGDLLAGFLGGLLAQRRLQGEVEQVLRYGVWQHGAAADELQRVRGGWTIEELADELGRGNKPS